MARFFIVTINYAPEPSGFAPHATQLAEYLGRAGHDVTVFTGFPFAPAWRRREADRGRLFAREQVGGATIYRLSHVIPRRPSSVPQRIAMEGTFALSAFAAMLVRALRRGRPDAVLYLGAHPAAAMASRLFGALIRRPYMVRITDLAASAAQDVGMVGRRLAGLLERFEFAAYRKAAGASVLCRSFEGALTAHGYPAHKILVLQNPIDIELIRPIPRTGAFRARYGIPADAFVLLHAGSMGRKQALMNVVHAAALIPARAICWMLVGDGEARTDLEHAVREQGVEKTVRFVPFQPEADMSVMFADADVLLISQISAVKDTLIPGKLLTYMAAGRPVLAAVNSASQAAELLRDADGGLLAAPDNPRALADAAMAMATAPRERLDAWGARNRAYAEQHFDERKILAEQETFMLQAS